MTHFTTQLDRHSFCKIGNHAQLFFLNLKTSFILKWYDQIGGGGGGEGGVDTSWVAVENLEVWLSAQPIYS